MLMNSIAPTIVHTNLESTVRLIYSNIILKELPNMDYMRKVQRSIHAIIEIRVVYKLEKNPD